jgi:hypothetical protein
VLKTLLGTLLIATLAVATVVTACTMMTPWRRELRDKRLDEARLVELGGLGLVRLAPTFRARGVVRADAGGVVFRYEQGQHHVLGGHLGNPVLLDVTLLAAPDAGRAVPRIDGTTIGTFYPPVDDPSRRSAHFAAQRWLPDTRDADGAITRVAATNEGRGDDVSSGPPERWLAIHLDPARRVRVDLYAWRSAYSADEARALVRQIAATATTTPALDARLAAIAAEDRTRAARGRTGPADAAAILRRCGVPRLAAGDAVVGTSCVAHLSADGLRLRVAALVGRVPLAASRGTPGQVARFDVAPGAPELGVSLMWWDGSRWAVEGLQHTLSGENLRHPVLDAVAARLADRGAVHLLRTFGVDFEHAPEGVADLEPFLAETERQVSALTAGTLLPGVRGAAVRLDR